MDALLDLDLFAPAGAPGRPAALYDAGEEISDDPVTAWRSGDREVINKQLAELELRRNGLRRLAPAAGRIERGQCSDERGDGQVNRHQLARVHAAVNSNDQPRR